MVISNLVDYRRSAIKYVVLAGLIVWGNGFALNASTHETIQACVDAKQLPLSTLARAKIATCLHWQDAAGFCGGYYEPFHIKVLDDPSEIRLGADEFSLKAEGQSVLKGQVRLHQGGVMVDANTAYVERDPKTKQIINVHLLGDVRYAEEGRRMWADELTLHPNDSTGVVNHVLYQWDSKRAGARLPAWGRANVVERFANKNYRLHLATYTTCAPRDGSWMIKARDITLHDATQTGVAKDAVLNVLDWPVLYTPYMSFPTSSARKSGFLMPMYGYSNVGGFDVATPYYWNIAPAFDATLVPHVYSRRGMMLGAEARYLTTNSRGMFGGNILPQDAAFNQFLLQNQDVYPAIQGLSSNRWSLAFDDTTTWNDDLVLDINVRQVSDDYYLQDFSSNLSVLTENQLPREGRLTYTMDHWLFQGMMQSYQTLSPINQSMIANVYERLPELLAHGNYTDLPLNANFSLDAQFDYFRWPMPNATQPQGPRYHVDPILSLPLSNTWGYLTPSVEWVVNDYDLHYGANIDAHTYDVSLPRYSVDMGLTLERDTHWFHKPMVQTLEPRLYYLNVPYQYQSDFPAFDAAYMIFNTDQLFRNNRFSGFDRIGDANQLGYGLTTRWLSDDDGREKALITVGQLRYFSKRQVQLCYEWDTNCQDTPLTLGYLSPEATYSPIASRAVYHLNTSWMVSADYAWDPNAHASNNGYLNLHYQPASNKIMTLGYTYLVNGNLIDINDLGLQQSSLNQITGAYGWPLSEKWSTLGAYSYNISKGYNMLTLFGVQYDTCCWAFRLLGGRAFQSLTTTDSTPQYNNNVYFQVLLKGLGSMANSDPASAIRTYLPGYENIFR